MREIKFRAWCDGTHDGLTFSKPHMDYDVTLSPKGYWCNVEGGWDIHGDYKTVPVMQYTGLKDKNGVEIYEGDICKFVSTKYPERIEVEQDGVQVVEYGMFGFQYKNPATPNQTCSYMTPGCVKVIGNIYQNQELLEAK